MQKNIIFKNVDGKVTIIANNNLNYESFIKILKDRLDKLYIKDDLLKSNIVLDIKNIELDSKKILSLFDVLADYQCFYIDKIIYKENKNKNIVLYEGNIRAGEVKLFTGNTLLVGNINKGAMVIACGDLYVVGKINGVVQFKHIFNKLTCANVSDTFIKICNLEYKIAGDIDNVVIKVKDNQVVEEKFRDRRENIYGKSNCSYIW